MFRNLLNTNDNHRRVVTATIVGLFAWQGLNLSAAVCAAPIAPTMTPANPAPPLLPGQTGHDFEEAMSYGSIELSKGSFQGAADNYRAAIKFKSDQAPAHLGLGQALAGLGLNEEAQQEIFKALQLDATLIDARFAWGGILMKKGSWDEAAGQFLQILKTHPNDLPTRGNLGVCYEQKGQVDAAIEQFRYMTQIDPNNVDAHYNLACAYDLKQQYEAAAGEYAKVMKLNPKHPMALVGLGNCLINQRDFVKAMRLHQAEIKLHPDNYYAYIGLGRVYECLEKPKEANLAYRNAIRIAPKAPECEKLMQNMMKTRTKELGLQNLDLVH